MKNAILVICIVVAFHVDPASAAAGVAGFAIVLLAQCIFRLLAYTWEAAVLVGLVPQNMLLMAALLNHPIADQPEGLVRFAASALLATYGLYQRYVR